MSDYQNEMKLEIAPFHYETVLRPAPDPLLLLQQRPALRPPPLLPRSLRRSTSRVPPGHCGSAAATAARTPVVVPRRTRIHTEAYALAYLLGKRRLSLISFISKKDSASGGAVRPRNAAHSYDSQNMLQLPPLVYRAKMTRLYSSEMHYYVSAVASTVYSSTDFSKLSL